MTIESSLYTSETGPAVTGEASASAIDGDQSRWRLATKLVQGGILRSPFGETCEAIYMSSGFVYGSAEEAEAAFANTRPRFIYSRFSNPTADVRGAHGAARGRRGRARDGDGHGRGLRLACLPAARGRPGGRVRCAVRLLPIHPGRDPAALRDRDRLRRWARPRPVASGPLVQDPGRLH